MDDILKSTILEKMQTHNAEMEALKEKVAGLLDYKQVLETQNTRMEELQTTLSGINIPVRTMQDLSANLNRSIQAWKQPARTVHHHHFPKIAFAAAGLFLLLALAGAGWYMTGQKLKQYQASDIKYRHLKLTDDSSLQKRLSAADSLYQLDPAGMRDSVLRWEEAIRREIKLQQQIKHAEEEVKQLKEKAGKLP